MALNFNPSTNQLLLGEMGLGFASGLLEGNAQKGMNKENQASQLAQILAQLQQRENENRLQATQMDPLAQQRSRAHFSAEGDAMRAAKPVSMQFDPNTGFGSLSGGIAIPEGGFSDQTKAFYNSPAMANAEAEFYGAAGMPYDLAGVGYSNTANGANQILAQRLAGRVDPTKGLQSRINTLDGLNPDGSQKHGSSWWKTALGFAPLALAPFTGGLSLAAQIGLGAGVGAGVGALQGGGVRGALGGAVQGGGSALLANQLSRFVPTRPPVNYAELGVK